jgi:hypothetical protein
MLQDPTNLNNGTGSVQLAPYTEFGDEYQAISAQEECENFSLEELRLADYKLRKGNPPERNSISKFPTTFIPPNVKRHIHHLDL